MTTILELEEQAVESALNGHWDNAITLNTKLITLNPKDIEALSRLAYAQAKTNDLASACNTYQTILALDPENPIAQKNLKKYKNFKNSSYTNTSHSELLHPELFVSDQDNTKSVILVNPASPFVLAELCNGQQVSYHRKGYELHIETNDNIYLGTLPDDIGQELIKKIKSKHAIEIYVKNVEDKTVTVFIKCCLSN